MTNSNEQNNKVSQYLRERIKLARIEANVSQVDLARVMQKSRVTISDIERGRVAVSAIDLVFMAAYFEKPISFFFPPQISLDMTTISKLTEEALYYFERLPETQQYIALEYLKQQSNISTQALDRKKLDEISEAKRKK